MFRLSVACGLLVLCLGPVHDLGIRRRPPLQRLLGRHRHDDQAEGELRGPSEHKNEALLQRQPGSPPDNARHGFPLGPGRIRG